MYNYLGTFLLAFAALSLELTLVRLLSVVTWYHLGFFAIATATLGTTAGATRVFLEPDRFPAEKIHECLARACLRFALVTPVALVLLCLLPVVLQATLMSLFSILTATCVCALPFYHAGVAVTLVLTKLRLPIGRLYASDLAGAAFGCLYVPKGLELLDAPSHVILCGAVAALAGSIFARADPARPGGRAILLVAVLLALCAGANASSPALVRPLVSRGILRPPEGPYLERWNCLSQVQVGPCLLLESQVWGRSPLTPSKLVYQHSMNIDGEAGTVISRFKSWLDLEHLRFDVVNVGYRIAAPGSACVIGVGGGRDIQSALLFGHRPVTGVDVNPIFIDLHRGQFRDFGGIAKRDDVTLVVDEARSYLSRDRAEYSIIQMSLVDTWASTSAGAFSLSENTLYTVQAWKVFLRRLSPKGLFTVSRWYSPVNLGETGRLLSLGVATLLDMGVADPSRHLALITQNAISTLLVSREPFPAAALVKLQDACQGLQFSLVVKPGSPSDNDVLRRIVQARSREALLAAGADLTYRCDPPTDEHPYFFNLLRLDRLDVLWDPGFGVIAGNVKATLTLIVLILALALLSVATIVVPVLLTPTGGREPVLWSGAAYFSLIGAGFMLLEVSLLQKLTVLLGHPSYALSVVLFVLILSTGLGSLVSEALPLTRRPWVFVYPVVTAVAIVLARVAVDHVLATMITLPFGQRVLGAVTVMAPLGVLLGFFFPTGMRLVTAIVRSQTPWYWALNGIFGVLASSVAVFLSIFIGISANFHAAAACYALVLLCVLSLDRSAAGAKPAQ